MRMFVCITLACAVLSGVLHAEFDFKPSRGVPIALFEEPVPGEISKPNDDTEADASARSERRDRPMADFSIGFWVTPFLRVATDPEGQGAGFGIELFWALDPQFGLMFASGIWTYQVDYNANNAVSGSRSSEATSIEFEAGGRFLPVTWHRGALYMDLKLGLGIVDGAGPIKLTTNLGGDWRIGVEFGSKSFRTFLEGGISYRAALNHSDAGWLEVGDPNTTGGVLFDFLRVGMRFYF